MYSLIVSAQCDHSLVINHNDSHSFIICVLVSSLAAVLGLAGHCEFLKTNNQKWRKKTTHTHTHVMTKTTQLSCTYTIPRLALQALEPVLFFWFFFFPGTSLECFKLALKRWVCQHSVFLCVCVRGPGLKRILYLSVHNLPCQSGPSLGCSVLTRSASTFLPAQTHCYLRYFLFVFFFCSSMFESVNVILIVEEHEGNPWKSPAHMQMDSSEKHVWGGVEWWVTEGKKRLQE